MIGAVYRELIALEYGGRLHAVRVEFVFDAISRCLHDHRLLVGRAEIHGIGSMDAEELEASSETKARTRGAIFEMSAAGSSPRSASAARRSSAGMSTDRYANR